MRQGQARRRVRPYQVLGYHPLVAVRSDTGEVLHSRMRSGSSQRGNVRFARETLARVRRLAADAR